MKVDLVDHMGSDLTVVNAARVSFHKESEWDEAGDGYLSEADTKLIRYLAKHNHWSPFAHTSIQLRVKAPIFVARQLVKHQVGGVWNEVSRRYVDEEPEFWFPDVWRGRPEGSMKQGSSGEVYSNLGIDGNKIAALAVEKCLFIYQNMLIDGVAPEQARMVLPQNMQTEWYWTGSLMFFARVCQLRLDPHAQAETREIAVQISQICQGLFPVSWSELVHEEVHENCRKWDCDRVKVRCHAFHPV
jgi:thymidylate synthase (FAD)